MYSYYYVIYDNFNKLTYLYIIHHALQDKAYSVNWHVHHEKCLIVNITAGGSDIHQGRGGQ